MPPLVSRSSKVPAVDVAAARHSLSHAWASYRQSAIQHFRHGLEFGRVCYDWRTRYKAQGSRKGKGFDHLLKTLGIPKTTAYRWIRHYEMRNGLRAMRNEVQYTHQDQDDHKRSEKPNLFRFLLTEERKKQFEDDNNTLGGRKKVVQMFLHFVARSAFEKRAADAVVSKTVASAADYRVTATG